MLHCKCEKKCTCLYGWNQFCYFQDKKKLLQNFSKIKLFWFCCSIAAAKICFLNNIQYKLNAAHRLQYIFSNKTERWWWILINVYIYWSKFYYHDIWNKDDKIKLNDDEKIKLINFCKKYCGTMQTLTEAAK